MCITFHDAYACGCILQRVEECPEQSTSRRVWRSLLGRTKECPNGTVASQPLPRGGPCPRCSRAARAASEAQGKMSATGDFAIPRRSVGAPPQTQRPGGHRGDAFFFAPEPYYQALYHAGPWCAHNTDPQQPAAYTPAHAPQESGVVSTNNPYDDPSAAGGLAHAQRGESQPRPSPVRTRQLTPLRTSCPEPRPGHAAHDTDGEVSPLDSPDKAGTPREVSPLEEPVEEWPAVTPLPHGFPPFTP